MELIIKEKIDQPVYKNQYELIIHFMEGDADDYHESVVRIAKEHEEELKDLLKVVIDCNKAYPRGRGGYDHVPGYNKYFGYNEEMSVEEFEKLQTIFNCEDNWSDSLINHPTDSRYGISDSFNGYELFYYNEDSIKYKVDIKE